MSDPHNAIVNHVDEDDSTVHPVIDRVVYLKGGETMAVDLEHPMITSIRRYGYPDPEPEPFGDDFFGNEVYPGDTILVLDDEFFLKDELSEDAIAILEHFGAVEITAK